MADQFIFANACLDSVVLFRAVLLSRKTTIFVELSNDLITNLVTLGAVSQPPPMCAVAGRAFAPTMQAWSLGSWGDGARVRPSVFLHGHHADLPVRVFAGCLRDGSVVRHSWELPADNTSPGQLGPFQGVCIPHETQQVGLAGFCSFHQQREANAWVSEVRAVRAEFGEHEHMNCVA